MPRSYFRTLPDCYERKAFGTDRHPPYPPAAIACFLGCLCFAEQQPERGRFKSRRLLAVLLEGPRGQGRSEARMIPFLIQHGDLVELADGSLYVEGWDELQEGNWQVAERMSRYRARAHPVTPTVTVGVTVSTVTGPSRVEVEANSGKRLAGDGAEAPPRNTPRRVLHQWLSDHGAAAPVGWVNTTLNELVKVYGSDRIVALWDQAPGDVRTSRQYVQLAERSLAPSAGKSGSNGAGHTRSAQEVEDAFH